MSNNIEIVRKLISAIETNQKEDILSYFTEDAIFNNIPMESVQGPEAIWAFMCPIHDITTDIDWEILNIAEADNGFVLTERIDKYLVNGQWSRFEVMGIFELKEGKICHWRDYFDLKKCMATLKLEA